MGSSYNFTDTSARLDYGDITVLDGATEFTCLHWTLFNAFPTNNDAFFAKSLNGGFRFYSYIDSGSRWFINIEDANGRLGKRWDGFSSSTAADTWIHYAWTWKASDDSMPQYVNGVAVTQVDAVVGSPNAIRNSSTSLFLGHFDATPTFPMSGNHAYFRMYTRQLSNDEIIEEMNNPGSIVEGLVFAPDLLDASAKDQLTGVTPTNTDATQSAKGPPVKFKFLSK